MNLQLALDNGVNYDLSSVASPYSSTNHDIADAYRLGLVSADFERHVALILSNSLTGSASKKQKGEDEELQSNLPQNQAGKSGASNSASRAPGFNEPVLATITNPVDGPAINVRFHSEGSQTENLLAGNPDMGAGTAERQLGVDSYELHKLPVGAFEQNRDARRRAAA